MQPSKVSILSTGQLSSYLKEEVEANNIGIDVITFIQTEVIQSVEVQQEIEQALLQNAIVVFTSKNAIEAVAAEMNDQGIEPSSINWNIYCIANKTKELATHYFGEEKILDAAETGEDLANIITDSHITDEIIFFCGDQRRNELPDILRNNDIEVTEIIVYHTVEVPKKITAPYHGIMFYSPSAVRSYFSVNKPQKETVLFAIGNTTCREIQKYSENKIIISRLPDKEQMIQEVINYFS